MRTGFVINPVGTVIYLLLHQQMLFFFFLDA